MVFLMLLMGFCRSVTELGITSDPREENRG